MSDAAVVVIWQCVEDPTHRGWRLPGDPRGTCDRCLARTEYEREVTATIDDPITYPGGTP